MGVIQNQFNSALTGLTFLAQQTPQWQFGKKTNEAKMGLESSDKSYMKAWNIGEKRVLDTANDPNSTRDEFYVAVDAQHGLLKDYGEDRSNFIEQNKQYLPEEYAKLKYNEAEQRLMEKQRLEGLAREKARESAEARQTEISTADNNMKSFVEQIRAMRESGAISNRQAKSMIYKAEHQEDKNE